MLAVSKSNSKVLLCAAQYKSEGKQAVSCIKVTCLWCQPEALDQQMQMLHSC